MNGRPSVDRYVGMMVESEDTTDFQTEPEDGKPLSGCAQSRRTLCYEGVTTPSQAPTRRRCRDWTGAAYVGEMHDKVKAQSGPQTDAVAKAIVVRKSVAREGVRVRLPVIPRSLEALGFSI